MKERIKGLIAGIFIGIMIAATTVIASSGIIKKDLHYNNIKITMNGEEIKPTDANGNYVEPFIIDGTTYLPVRGVANALDLEVNWDASTNTVKLHEKNELDLFFNEYGELVEKSLENMGLENGFTYDVTTSPDGSSIIADAKVSGLDGVAEEKKKKVQTYFNTAKEECGEEFNKLKAIFPSLKKFIINVCEEDGDIIAKLELSE